MKIKISIEQEFDFDADYGYDTDLGDVDISDIDNDTKVDYFVNRFCEDIDYLVKYDEVRSAVSVEYIEE